MQHTHTPISSWGGGRPQKHPGDIVGIKRAYSSYSWLCLCHSQLHHKAPHTHLLIGGWAGLRAAPFRSGHKLSPRLNRPLFSPPSSLSFRFSFGWRLLGWRGEEHLISQNTQDGWVKAAKLVSDSWGGTSTFTQCQDGWRRYMKTPPYPLWCQLSGSGFSSFNRSLNLSPLTTCSRQEHSALLLSVSPPYPLPTSPWAIQYSIKLSSRETWNWRGL